MNCSFTEYSRSTKIPIVSSVIDGTIAHVKSLRRKTIHMIEFYGGEGVWTEIKGRRLALPVLGTPAISASKLSKSDKDWCLTVVEKNRKSCDLLHVNIAGVLGRTSLPSNVRILNGNATKPNCFDSIKSSKSHGLIFLDPGGPGSYDFQANLYELCKRMPNMSVLIHFSATARKRAIGKHVDKEFGDIVDLRKMPHKHKLIHMVDDRPFNSHQWTYLYFTNTDVLPTKIQMFPLKGDVGDMLWWKANHVHG